MHPDLIIRVAQQDFAERIRDAERERLARLARSDREMRVTDRLGATLRRSLAGWQAPRADRLVPTRGDTTADTPCP